jgi:hypothetical protein
MTQINPFESMFLQTTLIRIPLDYLKVNVSATGDALFHDRIIYNLDLQKNLPMSVASPKFVFAHLVIPHWPYVFLPNGGYVPGGGDINGFLIGKTPSEGLVGYPRSMAFINRAMIQVVDQIIARSKAPPVIIIQGDHGAFRFDDPSQRVTILNAYYLPGAKAVLYPTITPVNTFRIVLNSYFGQDYPLLPDVSRFSPYDDATTSKSSPIPVRNNPASWSNDPTPTPQLPRALMQPIDVTLV